MTDLLTRHLRPSTSGRAGHVALGRPRGRPLALNAAVAAVAAVGSGLALCWLVALVGWFGSDGGAHGRSTAALSVGSGAWLVSHGADVHLDGAVVTAVPLGLTVLFLWIAYRAARWAGATSEVEDLWSLGLAAVVMGGTYGCLALATAVVATGTRAAPDPIGAFLGGAAVGTAAGVAGLVVGADLRSELRALLPGHARAVLFGGFVGVTSLWAAGALLAALAVAWRGESVANVLSRLHVDAADGFFSLLVVVALAPNLAAWGASYLLGGGFALGTGTVVSPTEVVLGPVPAVPVLAAVPDAGPAPAWALGVVAVPVVCGLLVGWAVTRRFPTRSYRLATGRACGAALLAASALTLLAAWSGGAIGGGRMQQIGPGLGAFFLMAVLTLVGGALAASAGRVWWQDRRGASSADADPHQGLQRRLPWRDQSAADRRAEAWRARHAALSAMRPRRERGAKDTTPSWARLGVWGAQNPAPPQTPSDVPGQRSHPDATDDEDTTFLSR
jgi:hypothetical protein